jgi:transcriptional regulator with XRE-family HTH domain
VKCTLTGTTATTETSFRLFLQSELARRCARNAQYSLRAFAMHLGVDHSTLSQWLRGRRPISARSIETIGATLGLPHETIGRYVDHAGRDPDGAAPPALDALAGETVDLVAEWYHFAILELTRIESFQADSRWIARVLDISVDEVNVALQRLIRLDLLEMSASDRWTDTTGDVRVSLDGLTDATRERLQHDACRGSLAAMRTVPFASRDHTSMTLAVNSGALPRAFELVARFRQQLAELLQEGAADDVYQIEIAMFPVTTLKRAGVSRQWPVP